MKQKKLIYAAYLLAVIALASAGGCRKDPQPLPAEKDQAFPPQPESPLLGFYLLNEGNMNMNRASLDFINFHTGEYIRNLYEEVNPEQTKGLGDVANDMGVYGQKLYIAVNNSNKIEVLEASSGKHLAKIDLKNVRYLSFHEGKVYASAYLTEVSGAGPAAGEVVEIDTAQLRITRRASVGRQPEGLDVYGGRLYVANSGGYSPQAYETSISVVDLEHFKELRRIEVAPNLHRLKIDKNGILYVNSRGDYFDRPAQFHLLDLKSETLKKTLDLPVSNFVIHQDLLYLYTFSWNQQQPGQAEYRILDCHSLELLERSFINDESQYSIKVPYGLAINPYNQEIYLSDAGDYTSPGTLLAYDREGKLLWKHKTGDIPAQFAFIHP